jgi:hypothetical protein
VIPDLCGVLDGGPHPPDPRHRPYASPKEIIMEPQFMEWGPAHLRDDSTLPDVEPSDRPDDN